MVLGPIVGPPHLMVIAFLAALALDFIYPYHKGVLLLVHPVRTSWIMAMKLRKPYGSKVRGVIIWVACVGTHLSAYAIVLYLAWQSSHLLWVLGTAYVLKVSFSVRLLADTVRKVGAKASMGEWARAKELTQGLVRRDVNLLDEPHVISAAIESLAESFMDGFVSPTTYFSFGGSVASLLQRVANTLDGALGYKDPEHREIGWFSARADDVMNYIPARLSALLILLAGWVLGVSGRDAFRTYRRYCHVTESPNAGHPMAAMAAVLGVSLEKPGHYVIGDGCLPKPEHIDLALKVYWIATVIHVFLVVGLIYVLSLCFSAYG